MKKMVLYSGGLDSTVLLHKVVKEYNAESVIALSIFYGQKHAKESECARWHCNKLGVELIEADLAPAFFYNIHSSSLLNGSEHEIPTGTYAEQREDGAVPNTYVPYRNGLFLSFAAAVALQLGCDAIYYGAHADDQAGAAYPDCTSYFVQVQAETIYEGTGHAVQLIAPWSNINKSQIIAHALMIGMTPEELQSTWSCYEGGGTHCNVCSTCLDRLKAFRDNGIDLDN